MKFAIVLAIMVLIPLGPHQANTENALDRRQIKKERPERPPFHAPLAMELIRKQLSFGSRSIGRPGHKSIKGFLERELQRHTDRIILQNFRWRDFELTNFIGWICARGTIPSNSREPCPSPSAASKRTTVLLAAHWDSHPYASRDPDRSRRHLPVPGANDGGSGTAILLELARGMHKVRPPRNVMIVLFDGEDYGLGDQWVIGSKYFARTWIRNKKNPRPDFGILLDMVGDRNLNIHVEGFSAQQAPSVVKKVLTAAKRVGAHSFHSNVKYTILDDHVPLNNAGIPTVNIIDFDYPPFHTSRDTLDKVSPQSLEEVARVVVEMIYGP